MTARSRALRWLIAVPLLLSLAGCADPGESGAQGGNKAGVPDQPRTLRLATVDAQGSWDAPLVEAFASSVAEESQGRLAVDITWVAEPENSEFEQAIIDRVRSDEFELGWVGGRAWDVEGATTLQALQTPFLITDYAVLRDVYSSDVRGQLLAGLNRDGFVGLGLYPGWLRHPVSLGSPLLTLDDFAGIRFRVPASNASDLLVRALGAQPLHINGLAENEAITAREMDAIEGTLQSVSIPTLGASVTGNITFYPDSRTLFGNAEALATLPDEDRQVLDLAAARTLAVAFDQLPTVDDGTQVCADGHSVVNATPDDVARIQLAATPVRNALRSDPTVAALIDRIAEIRGSRPDPAAPPTCSAPGAPSPEPSAVTAADPLLEGTWETPRLTREMLRSTVTRYGIDPGFVDYMATNDGFEDWIVYQVQISGGHWTILDFPDGQPAGVGWSGTYQVPEAGTAIASEGPCPVTYHYEVSESELRFRDLEACVVDPSPFQVAIYLSAPFTRVK
jgi:TRAP-type C4-dicarboxylate transport system substrate-binding protein